MRCGRQLSRCCRSGEDSHPLGTHRRRVPDRLCFEGILVRLVTGCSWQTTERLLGCAVSDTTLRARRDEWIAAGVFDAVVEEALAAFDRIVGLDLTEVAVDGSAHKAPSGGPGTGRNPTDRGKSGWKWSLLTDRAGIPVGWAADGANRHDQGPVRAHPRHRRRPRPARRHRDPAPGPRLRQRPGPGLCRRLGHRRHHLRPPTTTRHRHAQNHHPTRGCDGPSNGPTRGCRTSDNSAATPTGTPTTDSPNSPSPSSYSSASNSSTGETAGHHLSANALTGGHCSRCV